MAFKDLVCRTSGAPCRSTRAGTQGKAQVSQEKRTGSELVSGDDSAKASQDLKEETAQKSPRGFSCWRPSRRACPPRPHRPDPRGLTSFKERRSVRPFQG